MHFFSAFSSLIFLFPYLFDFSSPLNLSSALFSVPQVPCFSPFHTSNRIVLEGKLRHSDHEDPALTGLGVPGSGGLPAPEQILVLTSAPFSFPPGGFCLANNRGDRREQGEMGSRGGSPSPTLQARQQRLQEINMTRPPYVTE